MAGETISIGKATVQALHDTSMPGRPDIVFPQSTPEKMEPFRHFLNERGHLSFTIGSFLVRSGGKIVLVDTGIGNKNRAGYRNGSLPESMQAVGIAPENVDIVLITHLHIDHVGWNTVERDGAFVPYFPRARYTIQRR